jgi:hypothetical protein
LLTPVRITALPRAILTALPKYSKTGQGGIKSGKYRVTEMPKAVFTAERKSVNTEICLAVFTEILLCCFTAVPRYRRA